MARRRRRGCRIGWGWAIVLLTVHGFVFAGVMWMSRQTAPDALRTALEARMLAWDGWQEEGESLPPWIDEIMRMEDTPQTLVKWKEDGTRDRRAGDGLLTEWAIICHRFSQHGNAEEWLREAHESLEELAPEDENYIYALATRKALSGEALDDGEAIELEAMQALHPRSWFVGHLARVHGLPDDADSPAFDARRKSMLGGILVSSVCSLLLIALALPAVWLTLRMLRTHVTAPRASARRLFRLWPVPAVLGIWSTVEIVRLAGGTLFVMAVAIAASLLIHDPALIYRFAVWMGYGVTVAALAALPVVLKLRLTRSRGILRRTLGFALADFLSWRWIALAAAGAVALLGGLIFTEWIFELAGHSASVMDYLSRTLPDLGPASVLALLLWGCVVAPVVEEIIFRGFLFTSMRERWGAPLAAVASSIIFAAIHAYGWVGTLHVFVYGVVFCAVFHRTSRLAPGIMMHGMINVTVFTLGRLGMGV